MVAIRQDGTRLGSEKDSLGIPLEIQGFDAKAITSEEKLALTGIPKSKGKHAIQSADNIFPDFFIQVNNHFRIGVRSKPVALGNQTLAEFGEIVDLAVERDLDCSVFVAKGLLARRGIDNRQATVNKAEPWSEELTGAIRPAMRDSMGHAMQGFGLRWSIGV